MSDYFIGDITKEKITEYSKEIIRNNFENLRNAILTSGKHLYQKQCFGEYRDKDGYLCREGTVGTCKCSEECERRCTNSIRRK